MASRQQLDLVEISPDSHPRVCRVMDYERWVRERDERRKRGPDPGAQ
jgi:translation initiation factor IF-3